MGKKTYRSKRIVGKLKVYHYLLTDEELQPYLPETLPFTLDNLKQMVEKHPVLYIKPNVGSQGIGIFKLEQKDDGYQLRSTRKTRQFKKLSSVYHFLQSQTKKRLIIQQGIDLERVNDHPYDIRIMVQRKPRSAWVCTGIFAKVGNPKKIVTNYYQGGQLVTMDKLYAKLGLTEEETQERLAQLEQVALRIAKVLLSKQPGMYELGIDLAYDSEQHLWLIEVNSRMPEFYPLKYISRPMYNRMLAFARSYGRTHG